MEEEFGQYLVTSGVHFHGAALEGCAVQQGTPAAVMGNVRRAPQSIASLFRGVIPEPARSQTTTFENRCYRAKARISRSYGTPWR